MSVGAVVSHPLLYALALAGGVGLGMPMGAAVVGAGALFGGALGVGVVLLGQVIGLAINWNLCRHWYRRWIVHRCSAGDVGIGCSPRRRHSSPASRCCCCAWPYFRWRW